MLVPGTAVPRTRVRALELAELSVIIMFLQYIYFGTRVYSSIKISTAVLNLVPCVIKRPLSWQSRVLDLLVHLVLDSQGPRVAFSFQKHNLPPPRAST